MLPVKLSTLACFVSFFSICMGIYQFVGREGGRESLPSFLGISVDDYDHSLYS